MTRRDFGWKTEHELRGFKKHLALTPFGFSEEQALVNHQRVVPDL